MKSRLLHGIVRVAIGNAASLIITSLAVAGDVNVSVNVNVPGLYGQITIGADVPTPELILPRPVVAVPVAVVQGAPPPPPPLYLHVPPGHERHWARHCREYDACGRPVYFVSDHWYNEVYTPRYRDHHDHDEHWRHEEHEREFRREEGEHEHGWDREHGGDHEYHEHEHDHGHDHDHGRDHDHDHVRDDHDR